MLALSFLFLLLLLSWDLLISGIPMILYLYGRIIVLWISKQSFDITFLSSKIKPCRLEMIITILFYWVHLYSTTLYKISLHFTSMFPCYGTCLFSTNLIPWGAYSPAAIAELVTIQTHKQSLSNQVPIHSWVSREHIWVKCLVQRHSATKIRTPRPLDPKSQATATTSQRPACIWSIYSDIGKLRVITAPELVILSGSFMSHSLSVRWHHH